MNILVVSGSPRKSGNTMSMVNYVEKAMNKKYDNISVEYLHLIDKELKYCIGCCLCLRKGGNQCPLEDDKDEILRKMHEADGIIFASPGYSAMVSGLFKNFLDRFMYLDHIPEFVGKPVMVLSTSGGDGVMGAPKFMANNSFYWWGCNIVDIIGIRHAFYTNNRKTHMKYNKRLSSAADKLISATSNKINVSPNFRQYIYFMFNKTELEVSPDVMPYRTKVWEENGWMRSDYYYETKINPLFKCVGFVVFGMMKVVYRRLLGKDASKALAEYLKNN
ncbi:NAD(P)H-dependent oxidoreductase [Clostridiaceae bacterium M8S5]|nr:NAD(P)H-dependent oxidoreductase [Clostridiaceae bacterium M8S5]